MFGILPSQSWFLLHVVTGPGSQEGSKKFEKMFPDVMKIIRNIGKYVTDLFI